MNHIDLFNKKTTNDLSLIALEEMWFRVNYKEMTKEQKEEENAIWIKKKILKRMQQLGDISHLVNVPLNKDTNLIATKSEKEMNND